MEHTSSSDMKLNIFALPNQTTIIFLTIVAVLLGTVMVGSIGTSYAIKSLALALLFLPVRAFFAIPDRKFAQYHLALAGTRFPGVQREIAELAEHRVKLRRVPQLVCPEKLHDFPLIGAFRSCRLEWDDKRILCHVLLFVGAWFIVLGKDNLEEIQTIARKVFTFPGGWSLVLGNRRGRTFSLEKQVPDVHTFGTFRRWYIAANSEDAQELQALLNDENSAPAAQAKLLHELYHFKTGDYWQLGYAGESLRLTFLIMLWAILFFIGLGLLIVMVRPTIQQLSQFVPMLTKTFQMFSGLPQEMLGTFQPLLQLMQDLIVMLHDINQRTAHLDFSLIMIFSIGSTFPFLLIGLITGLIYWPALWRMREFYADAGVMRQQREIAPYQSALTGIPLFLLRLTQAPSSQFQPPAQAVTSLHTRIQRLWQKVKQFHQYHPEKMVRLQAVQRPEQVFGGWKGTILLVGTLAILLEILTLTPLTLLYAGQWPMHFPTLSILIIISLNYLIPQVVQGKPVRKDLLKIIGVVMLLRVMMISLALFLIGGLHVLRPKLLLAMMPASFAAASHAFGYAGNPAAIDVKIFLAKAAVSNYAQIFVVSGILLAALALLTHLFRRVFTWYAYPQAERYLMKAAYWLIIVVAAFVGLTVLPFFSALILDYTTFSNPPYTLLEITGCLILIIGLGCVRNAEKSHSMRCPQCGKALQETYFLGKRCECETLLHSWAVTEYDA